MANHDNHSLNDTIGYNTMSSTLVEQIVSLQADSFKEIKYNIDGILFTDDECDSHHSINVMEVPKYLSMTNKEIFENMLQEKIDFSTSTSYNIDRLRDITILMHQLNMINLEKCLYTMYLQSGIGNILKSNVSKLKVWPICFKLLIQSSTTQNINTNDNISQMETNNNNNNNNEINDDIYLNYVNNYLNDLNEKQKQIERELSEKKNQSTDYTKEIQDILQKFIDQHLKYLRLQYEYKINYIILYYHEKVLEYAFQQQNNTEQQNEIIKNLFERKFKLEKAKEEIHLMQQLVLHNKLSKSLACIQSSLPSLIMTLKNTNLRQQLTEYHDTITNQYKSDMMIIYTKIKEAELQESKKLFKDEMTKFWYYPSILPIDQQFNQTTIDLIHHGLILISAKIKCFSNYKIITIIAN